MILAAQINGQVTIFDLDALSDRYSGVLPIGQKCKHVWNAIALDAESVDPFQCHIIGTAGGPFRLHNGQQRTECPKGLISDKLIPCNGCTGRCVNVSPGKPKYPLRTPATQTLINGQPVSQFGTYLKKGDVLTVGGIEISVQ